MQRAFTKLLLACPAILFAALAACGGSIPAAGEARPSGQSALMDKTFAGANKCNPKSHDRPFVIEWDATDMSSFEARAANDVIFVKYEGCELKVLDGCSDDSVKGALGAYGAVDWTSGSVEKIDVANEGELFTKLPLSATVLSGRVHAGEQFHMEYYVSGTRKATRNAVYKPDLERIAGCKGATHFVYSYNLGAFALGSRKEIQGEAGVTVWGVGAGGSKKSLNNAEKKGGVLTSCTGESAKETATCKVPVRLTLREISADENPDAMAARAPETPAAFNLASKIDMRLKQDAKALAHWNAAQDRYKARDGKACLKELDARDKLDRNAANLSTNPKSVTATYRSWCLMLAGSCDAGKGQFRRTLQAQLAAQDATPEIVDRFVEQQSAQLCQGSQLSPRDQLLQAASTLQAGASSKKEVTACASAYATVKRVAPNVTSKGDDDWAANAALDLRNTGYSAAQCLGRAGDCNAAFSAYKESQLAGDNPAPMPDLAMKTSFAARISQCKDFVNAMALSPRDQLTKAYDELVQGAGKKTDAAACMKAHETVKRLAPTFKKDPNDPILYVLTNPSATNGVLMNCLAKAGDCPGAIKAWHDAYGAQVASLPAAQQKTMMETNLPACKK